MECLTIQKLQSEPKKSAFFACLSLLDQYIKKEIKRSNASSSKISQNIMKIYNTLSRDEQKEFGMFISTSYSQTIQQRLVFYKRLRDYIVLYIKKNEMKSSITEEEFIKRLFHPSVFWIFPFPKNPISCQNSFLPFVEIKLNLLPLVMCDLFLQKYHLQIIKAMICKNKPLSVGVELYEEYLAPNTIRIYYFIRYCDTFSKIYSNMTFTNTKEYEMEIFIPISLDFYEKFPSFFEEIRAIILQHIIEYYRQHPCENEKKGVSTSFIPDMTVTGIKRQRLMIAFSLDESKLYFIEGIIMHINYWDKNSNNGCIKASVSSSFDILL